MQLAVAGRPVSVKGVHVAMPVSVSVPVPVLTAAAVGEAVATG